MNQDNVIKILDDLCKTDGYGHVMSLVSALWRADTRSRNEPIEGCFVPVCLNNLKRSHASAISHDLQVYDKLVENQLSTAEYKFSEEDKRMLKAALSLYINMLDLSNNPPFDPNDVEKLLERL